LLDNTQATLSDLQNRRQKDESLSESESRELNELREETQKIIGNTQRLSEQLVQIMS
jgi:hypothetical protein